MSNVVTQKFIIDAYEIDLIHINDRLDEEESMLLEELLEENNPELFEAYRALSCG